MPNYYTYLISSLPMLQFGAKPPFSFEKFIELCQGLVPDTDIEVVKTASKESGYLYEGSQPTFPPKADQPLAEKKWHNFERALRNELVKIRASRKHIDPFKYIRQEDYSEPFVTRMAMNAHRNPSVLEAEMFLDQERWQFLEGLALGHFFDLDVLIIYAYKLLILEKWERIRNADKLALLEGTLSKISG